MGKSADEARQFHTSRMQQSIQSARLPESRLRMGANNDKENSESSNTNTEYPDTATANTEYSDDSDSPDARISDQMRNARLQSIQASKRQPLDSQIRKKQEQIQSIKKEITHHKKMLASQFMPATITAFATVPEVLTGGTFGLIATAIATGFRWMWYSKQTLKDKIALRKQMLISSAIGMIPVVGVFLQGDLVSTMVLTPRYSRNQIKKLNQSVALRQKELNQLQSKKRTLLLNS